MEPGDPPTLLARYPQVRPDGRGSFTEDHRRTPFYLEYDTGTESLRVLVAKLDAYEDLARHPSRRLTLAGLAPGGALTGIAGRCGWGLASPAAPLARVRHRRAGGLDVRRSGRPGGRPVLVELPGRAAGGSRLAEAVLRVA